MLEKPFFYHKRLLVNGEELSQLLSCHWCELIWERNADNSSLRKQTRIFQWNNSTIGARGSVVGWGTVLQAAGSIPVEVIEFFNLPNPFNDTMAPGFIQPLIEMSTRIYFWSKTRPARKADNLTAICERIVYKIWDPRHIINLYASTACYRDSFTLWRRSVLPVRYELDCKYCYK
jgi:hypothetical protein